MVGRSETGNTVRTIVPLATVWLSSVTTSAGTAVAVSPIAMVRPIVTVPAMSAAGTTRRCGMSVGSATV